MYMIRAIDSQTIERSTEGSLLQIPRGIFAIQKRKHLRYVIEVPLFYSLIDGETTYNGGLTADASEGGLLVYLPERIEIGGALRIEIFYVKNLSLEAIGATAKAVWSDLDTKAGFRKHKYGLQFQSIDEENLNKLKALLKEVAQAYA
jgi:c-di-GMP-binding flagellar brake protein YcgR